MNQFNIHTGYTISEQNERKALLTALKESTIPDNEKLDNIGLFITRQNLAKINFIQFLYEKIIPIHGVIMEFGVRWGQNMALLSAIRGMLEPYNYNRKIIGFDTFSGFNSIDEKDGKGIYVGNYGVTNNYEKELDFILNFHNNNAPINQKKKYELCVGDASVTLPKYLERNPHTIIALAYFDFDLYKPTLDCLEEIKPFLTKGSVIAFDELNVEHFPGETLAVKESLGLTKYSVQHYPHTPLQSFIVIE